MNSTTSHLIKLADEHGLVTSSGVEINVNITHEDFAEMINANRTTITLCLQELKKLGYIHTEGRRIYRWGAIRMG